MGENRERCRRCRHPLTSHEPGIGCTEHAPGTRDRIPGACGCGAAGTTGADVLPFRRRRDPSSEIDEGSP